MYFTASKSDPQTSCRCRRVRIRPWQHGNKRFPDKLTTEVISAGPVKRVHGIRLVVALCSVSCIIAPMEPRGIHRERNGWGNQHSARVKYDEHQELDVSEDRYRERGYQPPSINCLGKKRRRTMPRGARRFFSLVPRHLGVFVGNASSADDPIAGETIRQFGSLGKRCRKRNRGSLDATHRSALSRSARDVTSNLGNEGGSAERASYL